MFLFYVIIHSLSTTSIWNYHCFASSVDCQRKDYPKHKAICRKIGQSENKSPSAKINENADTFIVKNEHFPTGLPPLSAIWDKIEQDTNVIASQLKIVLHSTTEHDCPPSLPGVYSRVHTSPLTYIRDNTAKIRERDLSVLEIYGYKFNFSNTNEKHKLTYEGSSGKMEWVWRSEDGKMVCVSSNDQYRSMDKDFWIDPMSLYSMPLYVHRIPWFIYTSDSIQKKYVQSCETQMALTPFETVIQAIESGPPRSIPKKFKALDFSAWNKSLVIHADHRNFDCEATMNLINSFMGVYTPISGKQINGYPVWERDLDRTTMLIESTPNVSKKYLEEVGIYLKSTSNSKEGQVLLVQYTDWKNLGLTIAEETKSSNQYTALLTSHLRPININELLSTPTALFSQPDSAFSPWNGTCYGHQISVLVAVTPYEHFEHAITLAGIEIETQGSNHPVSLPKKTNKKKKKKKKLPLELSSVSPTIDSQDGSPVITEELERIETNKNDGKYQICSIDHSLSILTQLILFSLLHLF